MLTQLFQRSIACGRSLLKNGTCCHNHSRNFTSSITHGTPSSILQRININGVSLLETTPKILLLSSMNYFTQIKQQQNQNLNCIQSQQIRFRWTKAKKKRTARYKRRQELLTKGIPLSKPPYYFPKDTPVVNAITAQDRVQEIQDHDAKVTEELQQKLEIAKQTPVLRHHMTGLTMSDRVRKLFELHNGNQMEVVKAQKLRGMELFQLREGDTGSSAVQVIALTTRIQQLQTHFATHKKDKHSKRGMDALYIRRRKVLDYMERKDFDSYRRVVKTLGLSR